MHKDTWRDGKYADTSSISKHLIQWAYILVYTPGDFDMGLFPIVWEILCRHWYFVQCPSVFSLNAAEVRWLALGEVYDTS